MEYFYSYKNKKTNLNLFFDTRYIDFVSLMEIETTEAISEEEFDNKNDENNLKDNPIKIKRLRPITHYTNVTRLLLKIHFIHTNYHQELTFNKDDEEAYIIYNSLTEAISKNPQSCH